MLLYLFLQSSCVIPELDAVIFESLSTDESFATGITSFFCPPHCNSPIILFFFFTFLERVCLCKMTCLDRVAGDAWFPSKGKFSMDNKLQLCICVRTWLWALHIFSHFTSLVLCSFLKRSSRREKKTIHNIYIPLWIVIVTSAGGSPSAIMLMVTNKKYIIHLYLFYIVYWYHNVYHYTAVYMFIFDICVVLVCLLITYVWSTFCSAIWLVYVSTLFSIFVTLKYIRLIYSQQYHEC